MKSKYDSPELEIVKFDLITSLLDLSGDTSGENTGNEEIEKEEEDFG